MSRRDLDRAQNCLLKRSPILARAGTCLQATLFARQKFVACRQSPTGGISRNVRCADGLGLDVRCRRLRPSGNH